MKSDKEKIDNYFKELKKLGFKDDPDTTDTWTLIIKIAVGLQDWDWQYYQGDEIKKIAGYVFLESCENEALRRFGITNEDLKGFYKDRIRLLSPKVIKKSH